MLDWTVVDDPESHRQPHPPPKPPRKPARWLWSAILGLLILAGGAVSWWATQYQTDVRRTRAARAVVEQPLPAPLPGLVALDQPVIETAADLPGGALEVTAVHSFKGVDDTRLLFRATRIFEADGTLRPNALVSATIEGPRLRLLYDTNDSALVTKELAPYLDSVVAGACDQWECPADVHLTLDLTGDRATPAASTDVSRPAPVNRLFAYAGSFVVMSETLRLPRPSAFGTPVDDDTRSYWRRAIADAALVQLALQVRGHPAERFFAPTLTHNAFFYALVLRQAARAGAEDEQWLTVMMPPEPGQSMAGLWARQTRVDHAPTAEEIELRAALGFLNPLIGADEQLERVLFRNLEPDTGLDAWLARSFAGSGRSALDTLYNLTGDSTRRLLDDLARPGSDWLAIGSCAAGQVIWTPNGDELPLGLSTEVPAPARIVAARPTDAGLDLVVALGDQIALRSAGTGEFEWAAGAGTGASAFAGWLGSTAALYRFDNGQPTQDIVLVRPDAPADIVSTLTDVAALVPAPTGDLAVTLGPSIMDGNQPAAGRQILRTIMPGIGLDVVVGMGFPPAWAPDGGRLAVILGPGAESGWGGPFSIGILPDATQPDFAREIWDPSVIGRLPAQATGIGRIAWAPVGTRIAAVVGLDTGQAGPLDFTGFVMATDPLNLLDQPRLELDMPARADGLSQLDFSSDGRYLSAVFWDAGKPTGYWYEAATGAPLGHVEGVSRIVWAPAGHRSVGLSAGEPLLFDEPPPLAAPSSFTGTGCKDVLWNPGTPP